MKNTILKTLSKPKIVIPVFAILAIFATFIISKYVGVSPAVGILQNEETPNTSNLESNINLSFPKSGRIESISIKEGQTVIKGETLAKLSAPDQVGLINQTKGALDLAEAEYASLNSQYASTKKQQDLIVSNAYQTLLSSGLEGIPSEQNQNTPIISGTYICEKEGVYNLNPYASSDSDSGYSFNLSGLEVDTVSVKYNNPVPFGKCGLQIRWNHGTNFNDNIDWIVEIPNKKSANYLTNKNAYELAIANREKILSDLSTTIGTSDKNTSVALAKVEAARGAYQAALGAYQNNIITAPVDGVISFIDKDIKVGQSVVANKNIISIKIK